MNTSSDVVTCLAIKMAAAGDPLAQPRALALAYMVQAWSQVILGKMAFGNRITAGQGAPHIEGVGRPAGLFLTPDPNPRQESFVSVAEVRTYNPYDLTPDIEAVCDLVLDEYAAHSPYHLQKLIKADPAYTFAQQTCSGVEPGKLLAYWSTKPRPAGADRIRPYVAPPPPAPEAPPKSRHANGMTEEEHLRRVEMNEGRAAYWGLPVG